MLSRTKTNPSASSAGGASLLFGDVRLRGDLVSEGDIQFDGRIEGNLQARGVTLGEGAEVKGEVIAHTLRVCGTVEGTIRADRVELAPTALVRGDVLHGSLRVEDGARIDGRVCCLENPTRRAGEAARGAKENAFPEAQLRAQLAKTATGPARETGGGTEAPREGDAGRASKAA